MATAPKAADVKPSSGTAPSASGKSDDKRDRNYWTITGDPAKQTQRTITWRPKRSVHEFFPNRHVPDAHLIRKEALTYLGTAGTAISISSAVSHLIFSARYWGLLLVLLVSGIVHVAVQMLRPAPPYLAVMNKLNCSWYYGSNDSSANYRALPYAMPPRPATPEEQSGPLGEAARRLLARWRPPEKCCTGDLDRCILSHVSSDCRFVGGVHKCSVRASPRFCAQFSLARHRQLRQVHRRLPLKVTVAPGSVNLPEAEPLGEIQGDPAVSEDCLFLSIGRPRDYNTGYPIIVFVTGSGYVSETSRSLGQNSPLHWADGLPDQLQAVVVRIGYRLGFQGAFPSEGASEAVNFGLADLLAGLDYLQAVAGKFGGDPNRVTLVGHGSGAAMVMALLRHQRRTGKHLAHAAWLSSGPSRVPDSRPEMEQALALILQNRWTDKADMRLNCRPGDTAQCRRELETMEEGRLLAYLTARREPQVAWARSGLLLDWGAGFGQLTLHTSEKDRDPDQTLEWLAPDGRYLMGSPTEADGPDKWADVPVVFANMAEHYEGFPGFLVSDQWRKKWQEVLKLAHRYGYIGKPDGLIQHLKQPSMSRGDTHGTLTAVRAGSLLRFVCPYRYLARRVAGAPGRQSNVYHYLQQYALKYPAKFLAIGDNRKHSGAFYGLDLLLMLGTAPDVAESWDRRDQAVMQHLQQTLSTFASTGRPPSAWRPLGPDGEFSVLLDSDGSVQSIRPNLVLKFCDGMKFGIYPVLRTVA